MKKFLKILLIFTIVIIVQICLVIKLDIFDFSFLNVTDEQLARYTGFYFNGLELDEKEMYARIDEGIKMNMQRVFLGIHENKDNEENIDIKVKDVLTAYFYDNPGCYKISNEYAITTRDFKFFKTATVQLNYITTDEEDINIKDSELENAVNDILSKYIHEGMSDYEKELAIHDALANHIAYYEYEDINNIPSIKHTAYGALVEKEAVCDGYSKAFKLLLDKTGIKSIIVFGSTENVPHAWNMVELEGKYYHVDVTSDKLDINNNKYVIHTYFNIDTETLLKTHVIDKTFKYPEASSEEYNYYIKNNLCLNYDDNLYIKLPQVISSQENANVLELKVDNKYNARTIIDTLYDLNFNNWNYDKKASVSYNKIGDIYVFVK